MNEEAGKTSNEQAEVRQLTESLPGVGGEIKSSPDDFVVEEIPKYTPSGDGEHLFLWIEKRNVAALDLVSCLARELGVRRDDIGMAGMKDRHAVTRQYISIPRSCEPKLSQLELNDVTILRAEVHQTKLHKGDLSSNKFRVRLRNCISNARALAEPIRDEIVRNGFPNYFGPQRFGWEGSTLTIGWDLIRSGRSNVRAKNLRKLGLAAVQSLLFNAYLTQRIDDGLTTTVLEGDVMQKKEGGTFYVTEKAAEQLRFDRGETMIAGPLFGKKMFRSHEDALAREQVIFDRFGLTQEQLRKNRMMGQRRAILVKPDRIDIESEENDLILAFCLPAGCYATVLLGEFQKTDPTMGRE